MPRKTTSPRSKKARVNTSTRRIARQEVKKEVGRYIETKYVDSYATGAVTAIPAVGTLFSVHGTYASGSFVPIVQGLDNGQYIGTKINPRYLKVRYAMDVADTSNVVSMVVIQSKGLWGNNGDMTNVYEVTGTVNAPFSAVSTEFADRFRVLYRREIVLDTDDPTKIGSIKIGPKKLRKMTFTAGTGSVESGHIMVGFISDSTAVTHPAVRLSWRFYYKDA